MKHVISLGAGVQSSTLALMAAKGEITPMPDFAVFADTQAEPESVYTWLDWLETQLPFPVYRVTKGDLGKDASKISKSKEGKLYMKTFIPTYQHFTNGDKGMLWRKCTSDYKILPIQKLLKERLEIKRAEKSVQVIQWLGISTDEAHRQKDSRIAWIENRFPLIEKGMSRNNCLNWMEAKNYPPPPRSACSFCPFHSDKEWIHLKQNEPKAFAQAVRVEKEMQLAQTKQESLKTIPYLHTSMKPLDQVQFRHQDQRNLFGNECEGFCGV